VKILVAGDVMVDRYLHGSVERRNPDGQGTVFRVERVQESLGGASRGWSTSAPMPGPFCAPISSPTDRPRLGGVGLSVRGWSSPSTRTPAFGDSKGDILYHLSHRFPLPHRRQRHLRLEIRTARLPSLGHDLLLEIENRTLPIRTSLANTTLSYPVVQFLGSTSVL